MRFLHIAFTLFTFLLFSSNILASTDPDIVKVLDGRIGQLTKAPLPDPLVSEDLTYSDPIKRQRIDLTKPQFFTNSISLFIDENNAKIPVTDFTCEISFDVQYASVDGTITNLNNQKLKITFAKAGGVKYDARQYIHFTGGEKVTVTITAINDFGATWDITKFLIFENRITVRRDYKFNTSQLEVVSSLSNNGNANTIDELNLSWDVDPQSACTHFDIEWSWLDADVIERYKDEAGNFLPALIFSDNSSRVTIIKNNFDPALPGENPYKFVVPTLYDGIGYIFYRVRPVQYLENGQIVNGDWNSLTSAQDFFLFDGHETSLNWQATTSYAEDGKKKTLIQYFDGTMRSRQTVTKDNASNSSIVAETLYDFQGRPAIQVLPSPTLNGIIQYAHNFNTFSSQSGTQDIKEMYDLLLPNTNACNSGTPRLDNSRGAAQYYSSNNPDKNNGPNKYIPDADGFPYTETRYSQDNTGRIIAQSGVGENHQLGTGRETKYFYGSANQKELDALFGPEVGDASHYFKNMVRDANGQYSVSYIDMNGKTIATALAGSKPVSLDALPSQQFQEENSTPVTENLLGTQNNIVQNNNKIVATKTLLVPKAGIYTFNYSLSPESAEIQACNPLGETVCYDCLYDLEIRISDNCNTFSKVITKTNFSLQSTLNIDCNKAADLIEVIDEPVMLPEGEYNVVKTLSISAQGLQKYKDEVFKIKNICKTLKEFFDETLQQINTESNCQPTCAKCTAALGTYQNYRTQFISALGTSIITPEIELEVQSSYAQNQQACNELCNPPLDNVLAGIKMQMLEDMSPGNGQYAEIENQGFNYNIYKLTGGKLPFLNPQKEVGVPDFYRNNLGQIDQSAYSSSGIIQFTTPEEFEFQFNPSWAEALLPYHPEYPKYKLAVTNLTGSYNFDAQLQSVETYAIANDNSHNYISNILNADPFFSGVGSVYKGRMKILMEESFQNTDNYNYSMWQIAWMSIHCFTYGPSMDEVCAQAAPKKPPFILTDCDGDWNKVWILFRSFYLTQKNEYIEDYLNTNAPQVANFYSSLSFTHYRRVFGTASEFTFDPLDPSNSYLANITGPPANQLPVDEHISESYEITCDSYKQMWIDDIMKCDQVANLSEKDRTSLLTELITGLKDVCIRGSDLNHIFGSSSEIPDDPREYNNFADAVTAVFSKYSISITSLCHPYLISYPKTYETQAPLSDYTVVMQNDPCVCAKLKFVIDEKDRNNYRGTLSQFIQYQYGVSITDLVLNQLIAGCDGVSNCMSFDPPLQIPGFFSCSGGATNTCIECRAYQQKIALFHDNIHGLDDAPYIAPGNQEELNANIAFEDFMNSETGFHKSWSDYIQFGKACENYNSPYECDYLDGLVNAFYLLYPDISGSQCQSLFVAYFNQQTGNYYTWPDIQVIFVQSCGHMPDLCLPVMDCPKYHQTLNEFYAWLPTQNPQPDCEEAFVQFFNTKWGTDYSYKELASIYLIVCEQILKLCDNCQRMTEVIDAYKATEPWNNANCLIDFYTFYNNYLHTNLSISEIQQILDSCNLDLNFCNIPISCEQIKQLINSYNSNPPVCTSIFDPLSIEYCADCFTQYMNAALNRNYNYSDLMYFLSRSCPKGTILSPCSGTIPCTTLTMLVDEFEPPAQPSESTCQSAFTAYINNALSRNYSFNEIIGLYLIYCGHEPAVCGLNTTRTSDNDMKKIDESFIKLYPNPDSYFGDSSHSQKAFAKFYQMATGDSIAYPDLTKKYEEIAAMRPTLERGDNCTSLLHIYTKFKEQFGDYNLPSLLNENILVKLFENEFKPGEKYDWQKLQRMFQLCNLPIDFTEDDSSSILLDCGRVNGVKQAFYVFYPGTLPANCAELFTAFFDVYYRSNKTAEEIRTWNEQNCQLELNVCPEKTRLYFVMKLAGSEIAGPSNVILPPRLCGLNEPSYPPVTEVPATPCDYNPTLAWNLASEQYNLYVTHQLNNFELAYQAKCLGAKNIEQFTVRYTPSEYHYTLYYYDQAGNLIKTIPPAGVNPDFDADYLDKVADYRKDETLPRPAPPLHTLATRYFYNTLSQVTQQQTPDAGVSRFFYDALGRLVVSQNAKQAKDDKYSYTQYDELGRIKEVGETVITEEVNQNLTQDAASLQIALAGEHTQLTHTVYDLPMDVFCVPAPSLLCQQNLRNRVSYTYVVSSDQAAQPYDAATFYSYDIHGNADIVLQDYYAGVMRLNNNRFKTIEYSYDLVSGKVNEVNYQAGKPDAFYHHYSYDLDNRLTTVQTSRDKIYWETDAHYDYYKHGPLSRAELGENKVQGLDYAYTLQGWLKGVNSTSIGDGEFDMGEDGKINGGHSLFARDATGFSLNYFPGDYTQINQANNAFKPQPFNITNTDNQQTAMPLYNGNIASMFVNIGRLGSPQLYGYKYDQLNRLTGMDVFTGFNNAVNNWSSNPVATNDYKERITYDPNGNILTYLRNGSASQQGTPMDNLSYRYDYFDAGHNRHTYIPGVTTLQPTDVLTNKLNSVTDAVTGAYTEDIKSQNVNNYDYDEIGNLVQDSKENINNIGWNVYGKISWIEKPTGTITYSYDAAGNRISKSLNSKTTFYVRDATGNVMGVYEDGGADNNGHLTLTESHLYGSSRLGVQGSAIDVTAAYNSLAPVSITREDKSYELSNHLGNVLVTVSDKKIGVDGNSDGIIDYYNADVITATDYYPFGMQMPGRKYSQPNNNYRYGFNGKENDKDISAGGQDFGERIYDGRLGKFLSVDPYYKSFPFYSPYLFAGNSPIKHIDENGGYKIDGTIKSKYPKIYKYLSKNLEKEMLSSSLVAHGFKKLNPKLTNDNLKEMFSNGTGPTIYSDKAPGMFAEATAKYEFDDRSINVNEKVFTYVEGVLKNKKSTKAEKTRALLFLKLVVTHETGHDAEKMKGGLNADGTPKMASTPTEQRKLHDELNIGEAGYELTEYIFGLPASKNILNKDKKELVPKIRGGNDANKVEVLDEVIKKANSSEEGRQTLPTVPEDDKKTPVIK